MRAQATLIRLVVSALIGATGFGSGSLALPLLAGAFRLESPVASRKPGSTIRLGALPGTWPGRILPGCMLRVPLSAMSAFAGFKIIA